MAPNADQAQHWDPDRYRTEAGFVADLGMPVVALLNPKAGERILDLGCGEGRLTTKLVQLGCDVVGVDASAEQIERARADGLDAHVMDGENLTFDKAFDAVFSNAALHWMKRPHAVIRGVARALKDGGRFVGEMGGAGNVAKIKAAVEASLVNRGLDPEHADPWFFPSPEVYGDLLRRGGFVVETIELIPRPTPLPGDIEGWLWTFTESYLNRLDKKDRAGAINEIRETLQPQLVDSNGVWVADYVRLRFSARLEHNHE